MKKLLSVLILSAIALCSVFGLTACDGGSVTPPHIHEYQSKNDEEKHWSECSCGEKKDEAEHSFTDGVCSCGKEEVITPEENPGTGEEPEETPGGEEPGDNETPEHTHEYTTLKHDANKHWYECSCGEKNTSENHTFVEKKCTVCNEKQSSVGLRYTLINNDTEFVVTGIGDCADTVIIIPSTYNGKPVTSIGNSAFYECSSLEAIEIPNSVTSIGDDAFYYCVSLISVTIGNSVTSIGDRAFYLCNSLTSVTIGNSVTSIGSSVFNGCSSLTIYCEAESKPSGWESKWNSSNYPVVWDCNNNDVATDGYIYTIVDGVRYGIKDGVANVVKQSSNITTANISSSITYKGNTYSVTSIGSFAFYGCSSLTSVTIGNSVTSIGNSVFEDCDSLTSVTIGNGVTSIGDDAFRGCNSLISISVDENNQNYKSIEGNLYTKDGKALVQYATGKTATDFIIPEGVEVIGSYAFHYCYSLTSVTIGNGVTSIGDYAFLWCDSLTIYCEAESKPSGWSDNWNYRNSPIVWGCNNNDVATDGYIYTFIDGIRCGIKDGFATVVRQPKNITTANIPSSITCKGNTYSVTSIGDYAFDDCSSLTSIEIPNGVTSIGDYVFGGCNSLTSISVDENNQNFKSIEGNLYTKSGKTLIKYATGKTATDFVIPNSVTSIGVSAFAYCYSLTSVTIGNSVTSIGGSAFDDCRSLTSITIPNSVTSIGDHAFSGCYSLTSVTIGDSVTSIGYMAFSGCSSLTSITIPNSVTSIGDRAFESCSSLTSIEIPNSVTSIGYSAFRFCNSLTSITIPNSVTSIGYEAFFYCGSLTSVTIGNSVKSIGERAFYSCHSSLYTTENNLTYVKANDNPYFILIEATDKNLSTYQINSNTKHIAPWVFSNCERLTTIEIPNSVKSIGYNAFGGCSSLTNIYFNGDVNKWVEIEGLSNLMSSSRTLYINNQKPTEIVLDTATKITDCAFYNCDSLTSVTIGNSVTSIGYCAFYSCDSLTSVTIPNSVTSIGEGAFYGCYSLTIYCEAESKPSGWFIYWNYSRPVVWGYKG